MQVITSQHLRLIASAVRKACKLNDTYNPNTSHAAQLDNLCTWLTQLYVNSANELRYWVQWRCTISGRGIKHAGNEDIEYICKAFTDRADRIEQRANDQNTTSITIDPEQTTNNAPITSPEASPNNPPKTITATVTPMQSNTNVCNNNTDHHTHYLHANDNERVPKCITSRNIRSLRLHLHHVMRQGHLATALQEVDAAEYEIS